METNIIIDAVLRNIAFVNDRNRDYFLDSANELFNKFNGDICCEHSIFGAVNCEEHLPTSVKFDRTDLDIERLKEDSALSMERAKTEHRRVMTVISNATKNKEEQQSLFLFYVLFRSYNQDIFIDDESEDDGENWENFEAEVKKKEKIIGCIMKETWERVTISFNSRIDIDSWVNGRFDSDSISVSIKTNKQTYNFNIFDNMALLLEIQKGDNDIVSDLKSIALGAGSKTYSDSCISEFREWLLNMTFWGKFTQKEVNRKHNTRRGEKRNSKINGYYRHILFPIHKYITDNISLPYTKVATDFIFDLFNLDAVTFAALNSTTRAILKSKKADSQIEIDSYDGIFD